MGLDQGGSCIGSAYRVSADKAREAFLYLVAREMVTPVYVPSHIQVRLQDGRQVPGVTFTVDRTHPQYAGKLHPETAIQTVRRAEGHSGHNTDYIRETVAQLRRMGVRTGFWKRLKRPSETYRPSRAAASARSSRFRILPDAVRGSGAGDGYMKRGTSKRASRAARKPSSSVRSTGAMAWNVAPTSSPRRSSGTA